MTTGATVILVDANPRVAQILAPVLVDRGYKVLRADRPAPAFLKVLQYRPGAILLDDDLPEGGTVRLLHSLRTNPRTASLPVLLKSRNTDALAALPALTRPGVQVLAKPMTLATLLQAFEGLGLRPADADGNDANRDAPDDDVDLLNPDTPVSEKLTHIRQKARRLFAFPFTVARVLQVTADDRSGAAELADCIRGDPTVSSGVLRMVNSVMLRGRRRISDLHEAVTRLGFRETRKLVVSQAVLDLFHGESRTAGFDRMEFWLHSAACGVIAEKLARGAGLRHPERAFLTGLLHDLGKLILDEFFHDLYAGILEELVAERTPLYLGELSRMGLSHATLGSSLLDAWNFPTDVVDAVRLHHDPVRAAENLRGDDLLLSRVTYAADVLAKAFRLGSAGDLVLPVPEPAFWKALKLENLPAGFQENVAAEIESLCRLLNLQVGDRSEATTTPRTVAFVERRPPRLHPVAELLLARGDRVSRRDRAYADEDADLIVLQGDEPRALQEDLEHLRPPGERPHPSPVLVQAPDWVVDGLAPDWQRKLRTSTGLARVRAEEDIRAIDEALSHLTGCRDDAEYASRLQVRVESQARAKEPPPRLDLEVCLHSTTQDTPPAVLVVEDEPASRAAAVALLEARGYTVFAVASAEEGLELLSARPVTALLVDLGLPGMDGLDMVERMRADERMNATRVLVLTGLRARTAVARAAQLAVEGFLVKPYDPADLCGRVDAMLAAARARTAGSQGAQDRYNPETPGVRAARTR